MYNTLTDIMFALNSTNSRLDKEAILSEVMRDGSDTSIIFCSLMRRAYDTYETFGVRKVPAISFSEEVNTQEVEFIKFKALLDRLADRTLTGNAAIEAIEMVGSQINANDWEYFYSKILRKDPKCGVNITTWNKIAAKVSSNYVVDVFSCQLAHDGAKLEKIEGEKFVEVKLDGVRVISIVHPDGNVEMYSRNGKPLDNFPKIKETLSKYKLYDTPFVLDGEVMSSSFQDLMKQVHRKDNVQTDDAVLWLFDIVSYRSFREGKDSAPQRVRSEILRNTIKDEENVKVVQHVKVNLDTEDGQKAFKEINKTAIEGGYEGIMLKDPEAPYEVKRTKSWLKIKPIIEVTLEVVGLQKGTGKFSNTLGALVCEGTDTGRKISVNVGSGLSDDMRDEVWASQNDVVGMEVEVVADAITKNQDGTYSLRFPRFKTFRGFEPGEKI